MYTLKIYKSNIKQAPSSKTYEKKTKINPKQSEGNNKDQNSMELKAENNRKSMKQRVDSLKQLIDNSLVRLTKIKRRYKYQ